MRKHLHSHRLRRGRYSESGRAYLITAVVYQRRRIFSDWQVGRLLVAELRRAHDQRWVDSIAWVVMPDHLHCIWRLPADDADFSTRWMLIKQGVVHRLRGRNGVQALWQSRFWEHTLRDERDVEQHTHYIHFNPVKHGLVPQVCDWPHSTFHRYVKNGIYPADWGTAPSVLPGVRE